MDNEPKTEMQTFVEQARQNGLHNKEIRELLVGVGWNPLDAAKAVYGENLTIPLPPLPATAAPVLGQTAATAKNEPISVVQNLSTRGFEYSIMFIALLASAFSLGLILHEAVNNLFASSTVNSYDSYGNEGAYTFAMTLLLVTFPIFAVMFLRLKKAELADPGLRKDPSRKRMSHFTQFLAFAFGVGYIVYFVYSLINGVSDAGETTSLAQSFTHMLITVLLAGGIFTYFWRDEHRAE